MRQVWRLFAVAVLGGAALRIAAVVFYPWTSTSPILQNIPGEWLAPRSPTVPSTLGLFIFSHFRFTFSFLLFDSDWNKMSRIREGSIHAFILSLPSTCHKETGHFDQPSGVETFSRISSFFSWVELMLRTCIRARSQRPFTIKRVSSFDSEAMHQTSSGRDNGREGNIWAGMILFRF